MSDNFTDYLGLAHVATTTPGRTPQYGLVYDLASGRWTSAAEFRQFVRDVVPVTQQKYVEEKKAEQRQTLHAQELRLAEMHSKIGVGVTPGEGDNRIELGLKGIGSLLGQGIDFIAAGPGGEDDDYKRYAAHGGLLTKDEFMSFGSRTRTYLIDRAVGNKRTAQLGTSVMGLPGAEGVATGLSLASRAGRTAFDVVGGSGIIPVLPKDKGGTLADLVSPDDWRQAWKEADHSSIGNMFIDRELSPFVSQDTLDQWKRDSSWYQMASVGAEFGLLWHADASVVLGKGVGAAARLRKGELPLKEDSQYSVGMRQSLQRERITVRNPVTRKVIDFRQAGFDRAWDDLRDYANAVSDSEFRQLGMFAPRSRAIDGGAAAHALHYAARYGDRINEALNTDRMRDALGKVTDANGNAVPVPETLDIWDLTKQLTLNDPKAHALLAKMQEVAPDELNEFAPGAGTLLDSLDALKTKNSVLQSEVDDLLKKADDMGEDPSPFHRWEVDTDLRIRQQQLEEAQQALSKYQGYQDWLDLLTMKAHPNLSRVSGPSKRRWSQVRSHGDEETESHHLFQDNQFGFAHTVSYMPRAFFQKKASTAELHSIDSTLESVDRQFEQFEHIYGYVPEPGVREAIERRIVNAADPKERYRAMYDLENTHLINAMSQKFGLAPETVRSIVDKIHAEQARAKAGILSGEGQVYRSQPTLRDRLTGNDARIKLAEKSEDGNYYTINVMHGRRQETYVVPKEALEPRVAPEDVTQTPNYYTPLDTRRLYYEFKHNKDVLDELNANILRHGSAELANAVETVGQMFNNLWKPAMLFRFAWPQRVLMDEGARALAIFGPSYWLTGPGAEAVGTSLRNLLPNTVNLYHKYKHPNTRAIGTPLNAGPVAKASKSAPDPFAHDAEVRRAPQVPETLWPKINPGRKAKIDTIVSGVDEYQSLQRRAAFWHDQNDPARDRGESLNPELAARLAIYGDKQITLAYRTDPKAVLNHPLHKMLEDWDQRLQVQGKALHEGPRFFDPVTGKRVRKGHVVLLDPENSISFGFEPGEAGERGVRQGAISRFEASAAWYKKNSEMLSRAGIRIVVTPEGELALGRWFPTSYRDARDFLEYTTEAHPSLLYTVHKGPNHWEVMTDPDKESAFSDLTYRVFASDPIKEEVHGDAPIRGEHDTTTYHGTRDNLPEDLSPRDQVETRNGNMVGRGLYTTVDRAVANQYGGATNLYVVKGSKSGKRYKSFDLDRPIKDTDADAFEQWAIEHEHDPGFDSHAANMIISNMRDRVYPEGMMNRHYTETVYGDNGIEKTWANLYEDTQDLDDVSPEHDLLDKFLEQVHGAGVKTHRGGTTYDSGHQVYVFMHPEDIVISPRWAPTGEFDTIPEWFSNPQSVENPVPRNRIHTRRPQRQPIAELENPVPKRVNSELEYREGHEVTQIDRDVDMSDFDFEIDDPTSWVLRKIRERQEYGAKHKVITSSDGKAVVTKGAFAGHKGQLFRALTSSNKAIDVLTEGHGNGLSLARRQSEGHKVYHPPVISDRAIKNHRSREHKEAAHYFQVLADTVNDHIGNSPVWQRMLRGQSDDQIIDFLENTPAGQRIIREVKPKGMPTGVWVEDHRFLLDRYVPSRELQRRLAKGRLAPSDFRKKIPDEKLPDIYGPDMEVLDRRRTTGEWLGDAADRIYDILGSKPIDTLSRQPFFKAMYDMRMRSLVSSTDSKWLDEATLERFNDEALSFAKQQVHRFLYNLTDSTNMTDALRFIAPFWGAQYEAITKWLEIIADRPETIGRYFMGQRAVYNNFQVVDGDDNDKPVDRGTRPGGLQDLGLYHPNDKVILPLPGWLRKNVPGLEYFAASGIPIGSANTVLQGDMPLAPSMGPLFTVPADIFLKHVSDTYATEHSDDWWYHWWFPVGRPREKSDLMRAIDGISPGWIRRVMQSSDEDGQAFMNTQMQIGREMITKARREGKPDPTPEQIKAAAKHLYAVRSVASYILPFQTQFLPRHQYWVDAAHRYQKEYGAEWWDKFIDDYGEEAAIYATSSTNSVGVPPTKEGMSEWAPNKALIQKFPGWTEAIISPEAYMGDFSSDAYGAQLSIPLGPGSSQTLRSTSDLDERLHIDPETKLGWREYRKINAAVEAELYARGLTNIQQRGAEDLVQVKRAAVSDIMQKYPAWARDYQKRSDEIYSDVEELKKIAVMPQFDNRPDFQGVRQYLEIRQKAVDVLDQLGQAGYSRSLQSDQNTLLRQWFYNQVGQLVLANPAFAEFYSRYLDSDDLSLGGGGF